MVVASTFDQEAWEQDGLNVRVMEEAPWWKFRRGPVERLASGARESQSHERFIIDQGRVALPGARAEWGEWCNVAPSGFGIAPGTPVDNPLVDSIVWIKPGGESDGACGLEGTPVAGAWFESYVQQLVVNADASIMGA